MKRKRSKRLNRWESVGSGLTAGMFYAGVIILISALSYMVAHLSEADSIAGSWLPFMIAGAALVCISQIVKLSHRHRSHKPH